jgi:hypothetical protein
MYTIEKTIIIIPGVTGPQHRQAGFTAHHLRSLNKPDYYLAEKHKKNCKDVASCPNHFTHKQPQIIVTVFHLLVFLLYLQKEMSCLCLLRKEEDRAKATLTCGHCS